VPGLPPGSAPRDGVTFLRALADYLRGRRKSPQGDSPWGTVYSVGRIPVGGGSSAGGGLGLNLVADRGAAALPGTSRVSCGFSPPRSERSFLYSSSLMAPLFVQCFDTGPTRRWRWGPSVAELWAPALDQHDHTTAATTSAAARYKKRQEPAGGRRRNRGDPNEGVGDHAKPSPRHGGAGRLGVSGRLVNPRRRQGVRSCPLL